jgi:hypothetical protein
MKKWGFIYTLGAPSDTPRVDSIGSESCAMICVGVSSVAEAPDVARKLLSEGVELIELCGGFGGGGLAAVIAAVDNKVPVGAVFYGCEAGTGLHKLFG